MSFEGYDQILCAAGHLTEVDTYYEGDGACWVKGCDQPVAWRNTVDQTNDDDVGRVELEILVHEQISTCPTCNSRIVISERQYKVPVARLLLVGNDDENL